MKPERPRLAPVLRAGLTGYFVYHVAAITVSNLPGDTALGALAHRLVDPYLAAFGLWQSWDMFSTIPHYVHIEGTLVARNDDGRETRFGPILPGLTEHHDDLRLHALFVRLTLAARSESRRNAYLAQACREIGRASAGTRGGTGGGLPATVEIEIDTERLRSLTAMRADGRIGEFETLRFGEFACAR